MMKPFHCLCLTAAATLLWAAGGFAQEKTEKNVAFRVGESRYISIVAQGGLAINGQDISDRQTFTLTDLNGGDLADGDAIRIRWQPKGTKPTHWRADKGAVYRTGDKPDGFCTFKIKILNPQAKDGALTLQTASGWFVASGAGAKLVTVEEQTSAAMLNVVDVPKPDETEKTEKTAPPPAPVTNVEPLPNAPAPVAPPSTMAPPPENPAVPATTLPVGDQKPTIFLIGDSTVNNSATGQKGWGSLLGEFFDDTKIHVSNRARGGRSSRTFLTEGLWDKVLADVKPGDWVVMQFGHNDGGKPEDPKGRASLWGNGDESKEVETKPGEKEAVHSFGWYLRRFIADTKAKGATPIVLSLIPRNDWKDGKVLRASEGYGKLAREAAEQGGATFVDLNGIIADHYDALGQDAVKPFFPNEHTHTSEAGARLNAQSVVEGLKTLPGEPFRAYLKP